MPHSFEKLIRLAECHCGARLSQDMVTPIARGASGRTIVRIQLPSDKSIIGVHWTAEREDNDAFVPIALLLEAAGIRTSRILDYKPEEEGCGSALVSDLGDQDLLSFSQSDWGNRKPLYVSALEELRKLHLVEIPSSVRLQAPFDQNLYRWEQEYFAEHFVQNHRGLSASEFLSFPALQRLAEDLSSLPRTPLHRDFQSQNIHIINGEAWFIDFQGMRLGLPEYDLASLLYDPYASLAPHERQELIESWELISNQQLNRELFRNCAIQRLMQASGAYAKLSSMGQSWYTPHLPSALASLKELSTSTQFEPLFHPLLNTISSPC